MIALLIAAAPLAAAAPSLAAPPQAASLPPAAAGPRFDAIRFFTGATQGRGRLRIMLHHARAVRVQGTGHLDPDGTLVLDQRVEQEGQAPTTRRWRIREDAPDHFVGTLSDATGPVTGETQGNRLHLSYRSKGNVRIDQWLDLSPDGRSAQNRLVAHKLGLAVAHLDETIRKLD